MLAKNFLGYCTLTQVPTYILTYEATQVQAVKQTNDKIA